MKNSLLSFTTAIALLLLPKFEFAQAPSLGTAASFELYTTVGAVGNTGISQITGNVGTNSGAITGFGNVNGVMHAPDGATLTCAADLANACTQIVNAVHTANHAPALGGDTLTAGVYDIAGNTTLNNTLTLDAQGNGNAVFIFRITAPFATNANSRIALINGALACNVFWKVEGAISMGSLTDMKGNVIANNAAIDISSGVTLEGRALSTGGQITINNVLAFTPTGCGSPILTGPAAPALGTTGCYALFTGSGALTNAGITTVIGDVGTNVGLTTGFDQLLVTGMIHPIPDGSTAACASDLLQVYNYLSTLPIDIELLYPAQFGNKLVLTPHTYLMQGAASFNDTLFLNAQGNTNAVFVIHINGALSTSTFATVKLINGAQAQNVYWCVVNGAVSINDHSVFKGMIVCANGAIDLTTGVDLEGRALTTTGQFNTAAVTVSNPPNQCTSPLPLSWLYFRNTATAGKVLLQWGTTNELNNGFFTLERSKDSRTFQSITTVPAGGVTVNGEHHYSFTDLQPIRHSYYRISQTDANGAKNYYTTLQVNMADNSRIFNYSDGSFIYVQASDVAPGTGSIALYSMDGRKISSQVITITADANTYKIIKPVQKGMYLIYMESNGTKLYDGKVIVQ